MVNGHYCLVKIGGSLHILKVTLTARRVFGDKEFLFNPFTAEKTNSLKFLRRFAPRGITYGKGGFETTFSCEI